MNNFDNLTVKDYAHASKLYVSNDMRLAPKFKHLYHVVFNVNSQAKLQSPLLTGVDASEVNILAKSVDLPRYNLQTASLNQYNRKKIVQTGVQYVPINLEFHDDNAGLTSLFWEAYFRYYYTDSSYTSRDAAGSPNATTEAYQKVANGLNRSYGNSETQNFRYGLDRPNKAQNFLNSIQVYQLHPQNGQSTFTSFTLINPYIESLTHDTMQQDGSEFSSNRMSINYESVQYGRGRTGVDSAPQGFGTPQHYDAHPSPLNLQERSETTVLGASNSVQELQQLGRGSTAADAQRRFYLNTKEQQLPGVLSTSTPSRQFGAYSFADIAAPDSETIATAKRF
jgi:hypothetical protein